MKSKKKLKEELYKLIDSIDDEHLLNVLKEDIVPYAIKNKFGKPEKDDDLTEEQVKEFDEAVKEMEAGEYATMREFKKAMSRWLTK